MTKKQKSKIYARQGDVALLYDDGMRTAAELPRENGGVVLARGEVTGHVHRLRASGVHLYALEDSRVTGETAAMAIGRIGGGMIPDRALVVKRGAMLRHEEHGPVRVPAGTMRVRIQRQYVRGRISNVAD